MTDSEKQLIGRARKGDVRAFEQLVLMHQSQLRYSLRQMTNYNEALADDLAQETFIKAYRSIRKFRGDSGFSTWLYRIAWNEFLQVRRKRQIDQLDEEELAMIPDESPTRDEQLHRDLAEAMSQLTTDQRAALHLSLHRECTQEEIAEIMQAPLGTVKSHILRGKAKLRELLSDWQEVTP